MARKKKEQNTKEIKSRQRVRALGEVFTPEHIVKDMMDMDGIKEESYKIDSRVLEPSCGTGNFLVEIVARKMQTACEISNTIEELGLNTIKSATFIYGIDIMADNIQEAKQRMLEVFERMYCKAANNLGDETRRKLPPDLKRSLLYIMDYNIIVGDFLKSTMDIVRDNFDTEDGKEKADIEYKGKPIFVDKIILSDWEFKGDMIQRKLYAFEDLDKEIPSSYQSKRYNRIYELGYDSTPEVKCFCF